MVGARGTEVLLPEQKPTFGRKKRKRKMRGRAQPYRRHGREPGPTLTAMLKGGPAFLPNPQDAKRKFAKSHRRRTR
jgi:hypothetical protein